MSIVIERLEGGNLFGVCEYSLTQDGELLTTFKHDRTDDLKRCLIDASECIDRGRWEKSKRIYAKGGGG